MKMKKVYIVLMTIALTIFTGITVYLLYHNWSLINNSIHCINFNNHKKNKNLINAILYFDAELLKIDKKSYKDINIYNIGYVTKKKISNCMNLTVLILCI